MIVIGWALKQDMLNGNNSVAGCTDRRWLSIEAMLMCETSTANSYSGENYFIPSRFKVRFVFIFEVWHYFKKFTVGLFIPMALPSLVDMSCYRWFEFMIGYWANMNIPSHGLLCLGIGIFVSLDADMTRDPEKDYCFLFLVIEHVSIYDVYCNGMFWISCVYSLVG